MLAPIRGRMGAFRLLSYLVFVTSNEVQNIFYIYEGGIQMKNYEKWEMQNNVT